MANHSSSYPEFTQEDEAANRTRQQAEQLSVLTTSPVLELESFQNKDQCPGLKHREVVIGWPDSGKFHLVAGIKFKKQTNKKKVKKQKYNYNYGQLLLIFFFDIQPRVLGWSIVEKR